MDGGVFSGAQAASSGLGEPVMTVAMVDGFLRHPVTTLDSPGTEVFCSVLGNISHQNVRN